ncbi:MAG: sugar phosphate isomerase/epimerase [Planctomycetota bacterium]|nr:sugar phosphate isomerase/epimerase [Planctomycetota bacterium]
MRLGYNTNGLCNHRLTDALQLIADVGYQAVAITVDHYWLDPFSPTLSRELIETRALLRRLGLKCVIETGARFLLDPQQKHEPTFFGPHEELRIDFLLRCIDIAAELKAEAVSFWSGCLSPNSKRDGIQILADHIRPLIDAANQRGVSLAFEPEPGMFIDTFERFAELDAAIGPSELGLTIDIGHVQCLEDGPVSDHLHRWKDRILNIHIEDMVRGVHEHLRFGEGEIDFDAVIQTLVDIEYAGPVNVELSRHSHMAPTVVKESYDFLSAKLRQCGHDADRR